MKKFTIVLLTLCLLLSLAACGKEEAPAPTAAPAPAAPAATEAPAPAPTEAPAEEAPAEPELSDFEKAESCIDGSVEDLFALIGEPQSADYAPSCLGGVATGGEDGMLYYDGFIVYTYRENGEESVYTVMPG